MINPYKITKTDRFLATTFLKLFPKRVTPNQITIFRFFTVPFIAFLILIGQYWWVFVLFIIAAFSDALDGALARISNQVTEWGTVNDPLADKFLVGFTIFLILPIFLNSLLAFIIILLEMILIGMGYYFRSFKRKQFRANWWGKSKMWAQSIGVMLVIFYSIYPISFILPIAQIILSIAIALAIISLVTYSI